MRDYPESIPVPYRIENMFPRGRVAFGGVKTAALNALLHTFSGEPSDPEWPAVDWCTAWHFM